MKPFMDEDFLLQTPTARKLYHQWAEPMPIFDFHNHLSAREIYENKRCLNLGELWLAHDHYKWRAMRAYGISEELVTENTGSFEQFQAWAKVVQNSMGNPLYHWTHLELQRYFGICQPLTKENAREIWDKSSRILKERAFTPQSLLKDQNVMALCTTDDPVDDLAYHKRLRETFSVKILPTFRPDRILQIGRTDFPDYLHSLQNAAGIDILNTEDLMNCLEQRLDFFVQNGCLVSDHSLERFICPEAGRQEADAALQRRMRGEALSDQERGMYEGYILCRLARSYASRGIVMQLHIGALRNNSKKGFARLGADAGFDSMNDENYASQVGGLLSVAENLGHLPKTVLYCLNPKDTPMLACLAGCFQGDGIKGKVQLGSAWWFNDHRRGMEEHLEILASQGLISTFIGMVTDSRSFLSFPRHEYFRRIICNRIACWVENGEYPMDEGYIKLMIENICYRNAVRYFGLEES